MGQFKSIAENRVNWEYSSIQNIRYMKKIKLQSQVLLEFITETIEISKNNFELFGKKKEIEEIHLLSI